MITPKRNLYALGGILVILAGPLVNYKVNAELPITTEPTQIQRDTYMDETFVSVCTYEQAGQADVWAQQCRKSDQMKASNHLCTLMSYLRYCQPATRKQVLDNGWIKLRLNYNNVYLRR